MKLHEILMKKAREGSLAHFYIVETQGSERESARRLEEFVHHFIRDYYQQVEGHKSSLENLMDHPDVFVLGNLFQTEDPIESPFTVTESETLGRFFEFRPVQSKRKFAVITEGHRISTIVANKWLKLLEEPQGEATIFLLNPRGQKLLETIHSRAIHLRLPVQHQESDFTEWQNFLFEVKKTSLAQFLENNVRGEVALETRIQELISWESRETDSSAPKEALTNWLKQYQEMEVFHQPAATKWTLFYSYLQEFVLPRLHRP